MNADTGRPAMDQNGHIFLKPCAHDHVELDRQHGFRQAGSFQE